jgi:hypothetical protein
VVTNPPLHEDCDCVLELAPDAVLFRVGSACWRGSCRCKLHDGERSRPVMRNPLEIPVGARIEIEQPKSGTPPASNSYVRSSTGATAMPG